MSAATSTRSRRRLGVGAAVVVVLGAAAVAVVIGIVRETAPTVDLVETAPTVEVAPAAVYVHVAGAVARPGLYRLHDGARVVDAVAAAGGFGADADAAAVNLARPVADGEQLHVPVVGAAPVQPPAGDGRILLNAADAGELDELPGIGPALAGRIIAWRDEHGPFTSVDDLLAVPGIGEKVLEGLRDLVTV